MGAKAYAPLTVLSTASNHLLKLEEPIRTFRTYFKPREYGELLVKFWHSNAADSTWSLGVETGAGDFGGNWRIEAANLADGGEKPSGEVDPLSVIQLTFDGKTERNVRPGERFWSDEAAFVIPNNHYIAFTWAICVNTPEEQLAYNAETLLASAYEASGNRVDQSSADGYTLQENQMVLPALIAYEKKVAKQIAFLGDSVTQGVKTAMDKYENWVARVAEGLGTDVGVWNLGSGWARSSDLTIAQESAWMHKAIQCDELVLCLGVNDLGTLNRTGPDIIADLAAIVATFKSYKPNGSVILLTLPPFQFMEEQEIAWRHVNQIIREQSLQGVDRVFDIAQVLSRPEPEDNLIKQAYMSGAGDDAHPNGLAGEAIAEAFLKWY
ncbi:MAG: SGNH/GDSL hydrolase family protein [Gorillibacterium sp.]|nr:SGNH/GDSL hydrolase family protein [Gorillibacterium sp.]